MAALRNLFFFFTLHFVIDSSQINLDLTNLTNDSQSNIIFPHDCLYVDMQTEKENDPYQIISYCMTEWSSNWNIQVDHSIPKFTFYELYQLNITSEQLYLWSASIDLIESYQLYLNQMSTSNKISSKEKDLFFYNCTLPRFGNLCEYSLDIYENNISSLNDMIYSYYQQEYLPKELTCYMYLECNYDSNVSCLDWSQICDKYIDCYNGIDEKYCWQIEINECEDNEYRCLNGQCIPIEFFKDDPNTFECLDLSDEVSQPKRYFHVTDTHIFVPGEPVFSKEDVICSRIWYDISSINVTSSCVSGRDKLVIQRMFSHKSNLISDDCWLAFICLLNEEYLFNSECDEFCEKMNCMNVTQTSCPDIFFLPNQPVAFGHLYFAYTNNTTINSYMYRIPQYLCYNEKLCGDFNLNGPILSFNNMTCRARKDLPIILREWLQNPITSAIKSVYNYLLQCNTIIYNDSTICNHSAMYRCANSNKCISKQRVCDRRVDCPYRDDEECIFTGDNCSNNQFLTLFKCSATNMCIHPSFVGDGKCDCENDEYNLCADEITNMNYIKTHISFRRICDGSIELIPMNINGRNETDETECEEWKCNNIYTRCNGIWNCLDGIDELNCDSSLINCSSNHHMCVSSTTDQLMCLSAEKANDGNIDCLGAIDEPKLCQETKYQYSVSEPYCKSDVDYRCANIKESCYLIRFDTGMCKQFCENVMKFYPPRCDESPVLPRTDVETFFCAYTAHKKRAQTKYFSLDKIHEDKTMMITDLSSIKKPFRQYEQRCNRGLDLHIWSNKTTNILNRTCLCPSPYYGNRCQYQNQRISLTLKFRTYSDSRRTLFTILILLIDNDDNQQTIHSYYQFTYLYIRHCKVKFNIYLTYLEKPKNESKNYSIHIDIYEKKTFEYRGSFLSLIKFNFLPVHRLALQFTIPSKNDKIKYCTNEQCFNGKCIQYFNRKHLMTFCKCNKGWYGKYCTIEYKCTCSSDSLCVRILPNNQSLCICPVNKWGSQCLFQSHLCQSDQNERCLNNGECISINENVISEKKFLCICQKGFSGDRCEIRDTQLILSFDQNLTLPEYILVHFIQIILNQPHENGSTYKLIPINENSVTIYWSHPFHIVLAQLYGDKYYLIHVKNSFNRSETIIEKINSLNNCKNLNEIFNESIIKLDLIRRIKYYHLPCQNQILNLSCFYDENYFCLCYKFGSERLSNCFEFNSKLKLNCLNESSCQNGGECLQDSNICPQTSICVCPKCYYGSQCQFSSNLFGLSLDAILGYFIQPNISIQSQPLIVQISLILFIIMSIGGIVNSILCLITFKNKLTRQTGSGLYLLTASITTLFTTIIFILKFVILLISQIMFIENQIFLYFQCYTLDFFLQFGLNIDRWLCGCVAIERTISSIQRTKFNKIKSIKISKYIICIVILLTIITYIHDPIHRKLINDNQNEEKRIWCIVIYSSHFQLYNSIINTFHFFLPFIINLISPIIIIKIQIQQKLNLQPDQSYKQIFYEQLQRHNYLIISSIILVIFSIPRLIISFISTCLKSNDQNSWLFLFGYLVCFIPLLLHFILFVLPSKLFKEEFRKCLKQYRRAIQRLLCTS